LIEEPQIELIILARRFCAARESPIPDDSSFASRIASLFCDVELHELLGVLDVETDFAVLDDNTEDRLGGARVAIRNMVKNMEILYRDFIKDKILLGDTMKPPEYMTVCGPTGLNPIFIACTILIRIPKK